LTGKALVKAGAPGSSCGRDDFSDVLFHGICSLDSSFYCAPSGINCLQIWSDFLARLVVCFVEFRDGTEIWGLDVAVVVPFQDE
jgi:hypothetical protein